MRDSRGRFTTGTQGGPGRKPGISPRERNHRLTLLKELAALPIHDIATTLQLEAGVCRNLGARFNPNDYVTHNLETAIAIKQAAGHLLHAELTATKPALPRTA